MKHILAEKEDTGKFTFVAAPIPQGRPAEYNVANKLTLELQHSGEDYAVYCNENLTTDDLKQLELDWVLSNPQELNIVMV
ncbi:hypothetical protein [Acinetobacter johnsonii]|jgi:hypothetical protein|uniref:hypothetical protein n=1 Tax=Acinetobacter johnsonii TaxID=40214 RepID=UPI0011E8622E|nr:hypothetical protein [Acinetobacter johnsonii]QEK35888.1 hypothetical protein FYN22_08410 [Acinetobacter johnsonii]